MVRQRTVCVVTGSRAEFGLLRTVMRAMEKHKLLRLQVVAAGAHFLPPARTIREVEAEFDIVARVRMQEAGRTGRAADALALGRGVEGFARAFATIKPDWVVVLGDRVEAFAAASAASVGGWALAHIHGGDRAEGVADEAMRHAITKLAHLHLAATEKSAARIVRMGELRERVFMVGSPAMDELSTMKATSNAEFAALGAPGAVLLMHPDGQGESSEWAWTTSAVWIAQKIAGRRPVLWLDPNHDPGREWVIETVNEMEWPGGMLRMPHLPRRDFVGLLKALARRGGALVGNSSAGLIEAEATGVAVVDVGPRQGGRERHARVRRVEFLPDEGRLDQWPGIVRRLMRTPRSRLFGDGRTGVRIAGILARMDPKRMGFTRKRNWY